MRPCNHGAGCLKSSCTFQHPPDRPAVCKGGEQCTIPKCRLLHPASRCHFGLACTRSSCTRWHPPVAQEQPDNPAADDPSNCAASPVAPPPHAIAACRFGPDCSRPACKFLHPPERPASCDDGLRCSDLQCSLLHPLGRPASCSYGAGCTNVRCENMHPSDRPEVCAEGAECSRLNCVALHPKRMCFNGANCRQFGCSKGHPPERSTERCSCKFSDCDLLHVGTRTACRHGSSCTFGVRCNYLHPMSSFERQARKKRAAEIQRRQLKTKEQAHRAKLEAELARQTAEEARVEARKQELADMQAKSEAALRQRRRLDQIAAAITEKGDALTTTLECCVCLEDDLCPTDGLSCAELHFQCDGCFDRYVCDIATRDDRLARGIDVRCPNDACSAACFTDRQVAEHVSDETFAQLSALRIALHEQVLVENMRVRMEAELKCREQLSVLEKQAADARSHIVEHILTLKCPKCKTAFVDFDGCFALTCSHCPCRFCAWCLQAGSDGRAAHLCAASCGSKHGADGYYGTKELFNTYHEGRKRDEAKAFLLQLDEDVRKATMAACHNELDPLGVEL